ncbi:unnamed protein product, partial [Didymodactylos carnosus]
MDSLFGTAGDRLSHPKDLDIMFNEGKIDDENDLIFTPACDIFVRVKWHHDSKLPYGYDNEGVCCINGYEMKQKLCVDTQDGSLLSQMLSILSVKQEVNVETVAIQRKTLFNKRCLSEDFGKQFGEALDATISSRSPSKSHFLHLYNRFKNEINKVCRENKSWDYYWPLIYIEIPFMYSAPCYGIRMRRDYRDQVCSLIDFYQKYKHLVNADLAKRLFEKLLYTILSYENDIVLGLKLNFWPKNVQPFLKRLQTTKPDIYEAIKTIHMHLAPKCLPHTALENQAFEFRYSFSAIEQKLAELRTSTGRKLYVIARNIYYKHLHEVTKTLSSCCIKTSVLWMDETINELEENTEILAIQWSSYFSTLLLTGQCPHYFMNNVNLFESVSVEDREKLLNIIETNVVPSEIDYYTINPLGKNMSDTNDEYLKAANVYSTNNINKDFLHDIIHAVQDWDTLLSQYFASTQSTCHLDHLLLVLFVFKVIDGDGNQKNLEKWKNHFLDDNAINEPGRTTTTVESIVWEAEHNLHPAVYTRCFIMFVVIFPLINNIMTKQELTEQIDNINLNIPLRLLN